MSHWWSLHRKQIWNHQNFCPAMSKCSSQLIGRPQVVHQLIRLTDIKCFLSKEAIIAKTRWCRVQSMAYCEALLIDPETTIKGYGPTMRDRLPNQCRRILQQISFPLAKNRLLNDAVTRWFSARDKCTAYNFRPCAIFSTVGTHAHVGGAINWTVWGPAKKHKCQTRRHYGASCKLWVIGGRCTSGRCTGNGYETISIIVITPCCPTVTKTTT